MGRIPFVLLQNESAYGQSFEFQAGLFLFSAKGWYFLSLFHFTTGSTPVVPKCRAVILLSRSEFKNGRVAHTAACAISYYSGRARMDSKLKILTFIAKTT